MLEGWSWRQELETDRATTGAYLTAALVRVHQLPPLRSLLSREAKTEARPQSPEEQRAMVYLLAASMGHMIEKHDKPVVN